MKWSVAQARAIATTDRNLIVSAGAGSGKTAVLVERVLHLLEVDKDLNVDNILVMTFTEAAAGEMRQRIAARLEERMDEYKLTGHSAQAQRLRRQSSSLWQAQISTIHSFCLEVVRQNLLYLELPPDFRLLDANEQSLLLFSAVDESIEAALTGPSAAAVRDMMIALRLADARTLGQMLVRLYHLANSQVEPADWLNDVANAYPDSYRAWNETAFSAAFQNWVRQHLEMAQKYFKLAYELAEPIPELEKYTEWLREAMNCVEAARGALTDGGIDFAKLSASVHLWTAPKSVRSSYKGPELQQVKALRDEGNDSMNAIAPVLSRGVEALSDDLVRLSPHIRTLVRLVEELMGAVRAKKQREGVIDFQDLEHLAFRALSDAQTGALYRLKERYRHAFVDEYQDTSPIQDAIVDLVTAEADNLFAVGDVKQSIYRFRMAEPGLFLERYHRYQRDDGGMAIDLTENYRSRDAIVHFVNFAFGQLFSRETTGFAYDDRARMQVGATYPPAQPSSPLVEVHFLDRSSSIAKDGMDEPPGAAPFEDVEVSALEREARVVAKRIQEMMATELVHVWDKKSGANRPLAYGDIAVLLRSGRGALNTVVDVLQAAGIPVSATTSTGFFEALEVQWLISCLFVIDNPRDDLRLVTLLRSPFVGWDENMLALVRLASRGAMWDGVRRIASGEGTPDDGGGAPSAQDVQAQTRAKEFMAQLSAWRAYAREVGVVDTLRRVMEDVDFLRYVRGMSRGKIRRANVQKLLQLARSYDERTGYGGIYGFLQQWQQEDDANLDLGAANVSEPDAVQVMTIHRSKGLEYPVVFVVDLGKQFRLTQDILYLNRAYGIGAVAYDPSTHQRWRTVSSISVAYAERQETLAEEARVLYVAFTRARERLIVVGSVQNLARQANKAVYAHDLEQAKLLSGAFMNAKSFMDWMLPLMLRHPAAGALHKLVDPDAWDGHVWMTESNQLALYVYDMNQVQGVQPSGGALELRSDEPDWHEVLANLAEQPRERPTVRIVDRPDHSLEVLFGKVSATDMRRLHVALMADKRSGKRKEAASSLLEDPAFARPGKITPREEGIAFHAFMQRFQPPIGDDESSVRREIDRLVAQKQLDVETAKAVNVPQVSAFLQSPLGHRMQRGIRLFREQPFFHRIDVPVDDGKRTVPIVAQGVIDCLVEEDDGWVVIDYKTDHVDELGVESAAREYEAQVATYLEALRPLTEHKPVRAYLYFVRPNMAMEVRAMSLPDIFVELLRRHQAVLPNE
ncbi:helicase-exonuclease AddAB subunit AddA [Alicyclobacillus fastidiosus]|uniref:DNA 3'-5' helicase n=1 Tax=Alicyclobacillus fastidiosus TaxID=392011 RepID=A0ABV5ACW7_9BACL|nr:helicase-exonuclease AddAB subunit AddA [Alicyclobacillus fastidiosus]WEH11240.1 helicase-exonuclease AddAB subunit AddA [Alicyclobacillus fastidiosus]